MTCISTIRRKANEAGYRLVKYRFMPQGYCALNLYVHENNLPVGYGFDDIEEVADWLNNQHPRGETYRSTTQRTVRRRTA